MTTRPPLVSVVVPVYNGERTVAQALDSALGQRFADLEVVVVDDGSTDATDAIVSSYRAAHPSRIVHVRQANAGLPAARNAALARATGRYVALLDCDDVWLPDHLATLVPVLEAEPCVALAHANIERIDADGRALGAQRLRWTAAAQRDPFREIFLRREHVSCPTAVVRRSALDDAGAFDERFTGLGCEDRDLWLRLALRHDLRYVDRVTAQYRMSGASMSAQYRKMARARHMLVDKLAHVPRARPLVRAARAAIDLELGALHRDSGRRYEACAAYARAAWHRPAALEAWKGVVGTLVGRRPSEVPSVAPVHPSGTPGTAARQAASPKELS